MPGRLQAEPVFVLVERTSPRCADGPAESAAHWVACMCRGQHQCRPPPAAADLHRASGILAARLRSLANRPTSPTGTVCALAGGTAAGGQATALQRRKLGDGGRRWVGFPSCLAVGLGVAAEWCLRDAIRREALLPYCMHGVLLGCLMLPLFNHLANSIHGCHSNGGGAAPTGGSRPRLRRCRRGGTAAGSYPPGGLQSTRGCCWGLLSRRRRSA